MVFVVIIRPQRYAPISEFNCPKIDSIYHCREDAEERCAALKEESYAEVHIEEYDVLSHVSYYLDAYDERYYNEN